MQLTCQRLDYFQLFSTCLYVSTVDRQIYRYRYRYRYRYMYMYIYQTDNQRKAENNLASNMLVALSIQIYKMSSRSQSSFSEKYSINTLQFYRTLGLRMFFTFLKGGGVVGPGGKNIPQRPYLAHKEYLLLKYLLWIFIEKVCQPLFF